MALRLLFAVCVGVQPYAIDHDPDLSYDDDDMMRWREGLTTGSLCDARDDNSSCWYSALILQRRSSTTIFFEDDEVDEVLIHFETWDDRWDEWISITSKRIVPRDSAPIYYSVHMFQHEGGHSPHERALQNIPTARVSYATAMERGHEEWLLKRQQWFDILGQHHLILPLIQLILDYHGTLIYRLCDLECGK
jgi:hypothetical protein